MPHHRDAALDTQEQYLQRILLAGADLPDQLRHDFFPLTDDAVVSILEDRRGGVFVDGDDHFGFPASQ